MAHLKGRVWLMDGSACYFKMEMEMKMEIEMEMVSTYELLISCGQKTYNERDGNGIKQTMNFNKHDQIVRLPSSHWFDSWRIV